MNVMRPLLKLMKVRAGRDLRLRGLPLIFNCRGARMVIGDGVTINSSFLSNLVGLYSRSILVTRAPSAAIEIGNNVGLSGATLYARKGIFIGDNTAVGGNVKILDNDFHPIDADARIRLLADAHGGDAAELIPAKEIYIGKNCFIGCNAIVLKGTVLGDGCVVGAGAVVSGRFESNCVIAGNPARVIRRL